METCDRLLPTFDVIVNPYKELLECLLPKGHECEEHLVKFSNGRYLVWHPDPHETEPGDECYEYCECFASGELSADEANKLMKQELDIITGRK